MPVDEERWPGPSEYEGELIFRYMKEVYASYRGGVYATVYTYEQYEQARKAFIEESERLRREEIERHKENVKKLGDCIKGKPSEPTHVGPRRGPAFRNGKKRY